MLSAPIAALSIIPLLALGWWLRRSGRSDARPYGRLTGRICALLIALGTFSFSFVDAALHGVPMREAVAMSVWTAVFVTCLAVFPMTVSAMFKRKAHEEHREYLPW